MVAGGRTPLLPPSGLERLGYKLAVYPVVLLSSASGDADRAKGPGTRSRGAGAAIGLVLSFSTS
jgi:hypothetical protein